MHDDDDDTVLRPARGARPDRVRPGVEDVDDTVLRPGRRPRPAEAEWPQVDVDDTVLRPCRVRPAGGGRSGPAGGDGDRGADPGLPAVAGVAERVPSIRIAERVLRLDRVVIVGRRPAPPRVLRGPSPELVTVPSPRQQVSASHLAVSASGTAVVVEDLGSTNGTVIRPLGAPPIRMPSGGSMVVLTGTVVEIGDGNSIEILSPHLRVHPQAGTPGPVDPWPPLPTTPSRPDTRERS